MPGTNVIIPTPWKNKLRLSDPIRAQKGTATFPIKANIQLPDGTPINIATTGVIAEVSSSLAPNGLTLGDVVGGATDGAQTADVMPIYVTDRFYGVLAEAVPSAWYDAVVGLVKGSGAAGYTLATSGFITGTNIFRIIDLKGAAVGDTNALVEIEKSA